MTTRRELLTALPALILPQTTTSKAPQSRIDKLADELSIELALAYGGSWSVICDKDFILVKKRLNH